MRVTGLTGHDLSATTFTAAALGLYAVHRSGRDVPGLSGVRLLAFATLALGLLACATGASAQVTGFTDGVTVRPLHVLTTALGATALVAGLVAVVAGAETALGVLVAVMAALWLLTTTRHLLTAPAAPPTRSGGLR